MTYKSAKILSNSQVINLLLVKSFLSSIPPKRFEIERTKSDTSSNVAENFKKAILLKRGLGIKGKSQRVYYISGERYKLSSPNGMGISSAMICKISYCNLKRLRAKKIFSCQD